MSPPKVPFEGQSSYSADYVALPAVHGETKAAALRRMVPVHSLVYLGPKSSNTNQPGISGTFS